MKLGLEHLKVSGMHGLEFLSDNAKIGFRANAVFFYLLL